MFKLNNAALLSLLVVLGFAGCGKKGCDTTTKTKTKKVAQSDANKFDDSDLSEFAFVESDDAAASKKLAQCGEEDCDLGDDADKSSFKTVYFNFNKNDIRVDQKSIVAEDAKLAQQAVKEGKQVVVAGHCDQLGSATYNMALSERRAQSVKDEIIRQGKVAKNDVKTVGYGNEKPVVWSDAKTRAALIKELAPNRRAELVTN